MRDSISNFWMDLYKSYIFFRKLREISQVEKKRNLAEKEEEEAKESTNGSGYHSKAKMERRRAQKQLDTLRLELEKIAAN